MTTVLIIDGENFKGKIEEVFKTAGKPTPIWHEYDFQGLFDQILKGLTIDQRVFYFARIKEHPDRRDKSRQLIEQQRLMKNNLERQGFKVTVAGRVRGHYENGFLGKQVLVFREKGVDVKMAVDMVSWTCDKKVDQIILASSDSDLQPAIAEVKQRGAKCLYLGFETGPNKGISYNTHKTILIRDSEVLSFEKKPALF